MRLGQRGQCVKLLRIQPSVQHCRSDVAQPVLLLLMHPHVVAIHVLRDRPFVARIELEPDLLLHRGQHALRSPAVLHKQVLDARMGAALPQRLLLAEDLAYRLHRRIGLVLRHKRIQADGEMRLGRKPSTHTQAIANLFLAVLDALQRGQANVIDLRITAPNGASRHGDLELARQVVELRVRRQLVCDLHRQR